jgi:hypothetical protein
MSLNALDDGSGADSRAIRTSGLPVDGASAGENGRSTCGGSVAHAAKPTARTNTKVRRAKSATDDSPSRSNDDALPDGIKTKALKRSYCTMVSTTPLPDVAGPIPGRLADYGIQSDPGWRAVTGAVAKLQKIFRPAPKTSRRKAAKLSATGGLDT